MSNSGASQPSISRCVGQAVGILWDAIRAPVKPKAVEVNRTTETLQRDGVTLRRTTIDEVVVTPPPQNP
ncbi:MAG: hypothetical protein FJ292_03775 [Planctomycetes bacterium]|nr:hypothetical protein [Planctomycetota bacterium]